MSEVRGGSGGGGRNWLGTKGPPPCRSVLFLLESKQQDLRGGAASWAWPPGVAGAICALQDPLLGERGCPAADVTLICC